MYGYSTKSSPTRGEIWKVALRGRRMHLPHCTESLQSSSGARSQSRMVLPAHGNESSHWDSCLLRTQQAAKLSLEAYFPHSANLHKTCAGPIRTMIQTATLRFIDVRDRTIRESHTNDQYVTLSYRWGIKDAQRVSISAAHYPQYQQLIEAIKNL